MEDFESDSGSGSSSAAAPGPVADVGASRVPKRKAHEARVKQSSQHTAKRKKNKPSAAPTFRDDAFAELDEEQLINTTIGKMDRRLIADYVARQIKRFEPNLSSLELEERRIPESAFVDTSGWTRKRDLEGLPAFMEHFSGRSKESLSKAVPDGTGSPHTIVIAAAGLRAADLTRSLRVFQSGSAIVAKLFAKHIKLKDAIHFTKNTRMNIGVGTPRRLIDLIEQGSLSMQFVERIIIDASQVNAKKRGIFDMGETEISTKLGVGWVGGDPDDFTSQRVHKAAWLSKTVKMQKVLTGHAEWLDSKLLPDPGRLI